MPSLAASRTVRSWIRKSSPIASTPLPCAVAVEKSSVVRSMPWPIRCAPLVRIVSWLVILNVPRPSTIVVDASIELAALCSAALSLPWTSTQWPLVICSQFAVGKLGASALSPQPAMSAPRARRRPRMEVRAVNIAAPCYTLRPRWEPLVPATESARAATANSARLRRGREHARAAQRQEHVVPVAQAERRAALPVEIGAQPRADRRDREVDLEAARKRRDAHDPDRKS